MAFELVKPKDGKFPGLTEKEEGTWSGPFYFILAADTQFGLIDSWNGVPSNQITWDKEIALTNKAIECINKLEPRPKFVSICGDLVDAAPGTRQHELQIKDLLSCLEKLDQDIPLLCLPGNHDIGNVPTDETILDYKRVFGDDFYSAIAGGTFVVQSIVKQFLKISHNFSTTQWQLLRSQLENYGKFNEINVAHPRGWAPMGFSTGTMFWSQGQLCIILSFQGWDF